MQREISVLYWLRQAGVLLVIGVTVVAFSGVRQTPDKLWSMYEDFWPRRDALRVEWRTERAGEAVLVPKVRTMLALLRDNNVDAFRYSDAIAADTDSSLVQRIAESAYPIRVKQEAPFLLLLASETLDRRCVEMARQQEVVLALCP